MKQSFVKGAMILMIANAVSKILGAVFKIPLTYILQEEGMAIFNTAFSVYVTVLSFIISGMPLAISKLIAEELALGRASSVRRILRVCLILLGVFGIIGTLTLYFGATAFAHVMNDNKAVFAIRLISPSIFFVAIGTVYKSYYQGAQNMIPTAVSQVVEAFIKLAVGFSLSYALAKYAVEITATGGIMGVTIGEIIATAILMMMYAPPKSQKHEKTISNRQILASIFAVAVPMLFASAVSSVVSFIDVALVRNQLQKVVFTEQSLIPFMTQYGSHTHVFDALSKTLTITADGARWLYGAYSGYALTIFHLPSGIMGAFCVSILPVIAGAFAVGNKTRAARTLSVALRLTVLLTLPCAVIMYMFSDEILYLLFHNTASSLLLKTVAPCVVMLCISQLCVASLQASGKIMLPFFYTLASTAVKLMGNIFLIPIAQLNIQGAVISANICYLIEMLCGLYFVHKRFELNLGFLNLILKPAFAATCMTAILLLCRNPLYIMFNSNIAAFITMAVGGIGYILILLLLRAVSYEEIRNLRKRL
jgi:stage V sporulation protein B